MDYSQAPIRRTRGFLLVVSAPSGTGKNTLLNRLREEFPDLNYSISATTRPPRPGERDGVHYHFLTPEVFREMVSRDEFLEWAEVFGNLYGTPRKFAGEVLARGEDCVLDLDIQGARQLRSRCPEAVLVFLMPPSRDELKNRMTRRAADDAESMNRRLAAAVAELEAACEYDYVIVNDVLEEALAKLRAVVLAERCKVSRNDCRAFLESFGRG